MFESGDRVAVAVSGGPDSLALLLLLERLASRFSLNLSVAHFNHRLRGEESDGDEQFVREICHKRGLGCVVESADVRAISNSKRINEEAAARECRYQFLRSLARSHHISKVALGHTANDQTETFLMRLIRGAGMHGLASIHPVVDGYFVRPLLDVTREEVEQFLHEKNQAWHEDSSNADRHRTRNRIRHELLPQLAEKYNPAIIRQLAHTAAQCRLDDNFLAQRAQSVFEELRRSVDQREGYCGDRQECKSLSLPIDRLMQLEPAIRTRVLRFAIQAVAANLLKIDESHVNAIQRLCEEGQSGASLDLPRQLRVERVFSCLNFYVSSDKPDRALEYELTLPVPGSVKLPYRALTWRSRLMEREAWLHEKAKKNFGESDKNVRRNQHRVEWACFDYSKIALQLNFNSPGQLKVRNVRPGDHYHPRGRAHEVKVYDLLFERCVAASQRKGWPLLIAGHQILWARGCEENRNVTATSESSQILVVDEVERHGE